MRDPKITPLLAARRDLAGLERRFQAAPEVFDGLRAACEGSVARWEWANGPAYSLDPLFFLDSDIRAGQISSVSPENPAGWTAYGFTNDHRLVAERQYTRLPNGEYYQGYYIELPDRIIGYRFDYSTPRAAINCSQLVLQDETPVYFQRWGSRGWVSYTYACVDGRVESFVGIAKEPDEAETRFSGQVRYKGNGVVELWAKEHGQRTAQLSFRGRPPAVNPFLHHRQRAGPRAH